ncbi:hypothetical protein CDAR_423031 [Caerostris darwini]|uniref:Uncharacterized protein n=1 Tax=Caerostris darwini TaxID=1538125 RepID=A0AAV4TCY8_9ARAC|nr:hypothetical protein CDAR_423031 [Caerostris darwini]
MLFHSSRTERGALVKGGRDPEAAVLRGKKIVFCAQGERRGSDQWRDDTSAEGSSVHQVVRTEFRKRILGKSGDFFFFKERLKVKSI